MTYFIVGAVVVIIGVLVWRPWGKATVLSGGATVVFESWEDGWGDAGKRVVIEFRRSGTFVVSVDSPDFKKEEGALTHTYEIHKVKKEPEYIAVKTDITKVYVSITENDKTETCRLRAF